MEGSNVNVGTPVQHTNGSFTYIPETDIVGNDEFTYSIKGNMNASNTAAVKITAIDDD